MYLTLLASTKQALLWARCQQIWRQNLRFSHGYPSTSEAKYGDVLLHSFRESSNSKVWNHSMSITREQVHDGSRFQIRSQYCSLSIANLEEFCCLTIQLRFNPGNSLLTLGLRVFLSATMSTSCSWTRTFGHHARLACYSEIYLGVTLSRSKITWNDLLVRKTSGSLCCRK